MVRTLYGQASELPAALFDLGISAHINASIIVAVVLMLPKHILSALQMRWAERLQEARKEGKGVGAPHAAPLRRAPIRPFLAALTQQLQLGPGSCSSDLAAVAATRQGPLRHRCQARRHEPTPPAGRGLH